MLDKGLLEVALPGYCLLVVYITKKMFTQSNSLHPRHPQVTRPGGLICGRGVLENEMEFPRGLGSPLVLSLSSPGPSGKVGMPMRPVCPVSPWAVFWKNSCPNYCEFLKAGI